MRRIKGHHWNVVANDNFLMTNNSPDIFIGNGYALPL